MGKLILKVASAVIGIALGMIIYSCFDVVKVEGSTMLPALEPGQWVIVSKISQDEINTGDIVFYKAPFYTLDGEGRYLFRRVSSVNGERVDVSGEGVTVVEIEDSIRRSEILGKVIYGQKRTKACG